MNLDAIEYRNDPERFAEIQKKIIIRSAVFLPLLMIFSFAVFVFSDDRDFAGGLEISVLYILFIVVILSFSIFRNVKRQKAIYNSYKFTATTTYLLREQNNLPLVKIALDEIAEINEDNQGNLIIKGAQPKQIIVISPFIKNFSQLKHNLQSTYSISEPKRQNIIQKYPMILSILMVGSMLTAYCSSNPLLAAVGGVICMAIMGWSFYKLRTAPIIDKKTKRLSWWLIVIFLSMVASVYLKFFPIEQ